jgi:toxin ParE1/3/4
MPSAERRLLWSAPAENDLLEIRAYLASEASPNVADEQLRRIHTACETLKDWPFAGRSRREFRHDLRSLSVKPYIVFYRVLGQACEVVRVLHGHRDLDAIFPGPDEA